MAPTFNSVIKNIFLFVSRVFVSPKNIGRFRKNSQTDKILVVSLTHLGDIVLLSPFLGNLRLNYPKARIDILLKEQVSEILKYSPHVDNRIIYNAKWVTNKTGDGVLKTLRMIRRLRHARYDLCFVTHSHVFSNMMVWLAGIPERIGYGDGGGFLNIPVKKVQGIQHARDVTLNLLRYLDLKIESVDTRIFLGPEDVTFAERLRKELSISESASQLLVGIHPGAGRRERIWLPERYAEVIKYLIDRHKARILLFAGKQEA